MLACVSRLVEGPRDRFTPGLQERWSPSPNPMGQFLLPVSLLSVQFNFLLSPQAAWFPPHPFYCKPARSHLLYFHPLRVPRRLSTQSLLPSLKSLCLSSVLAALQLRDGTFRSINHPPTPPPSLSPLCLGFSVSPLFFSLAFLTIPKLIVPRDDIFFAIKSNQVLDGPIMGEMRCG